MTSFCFCVFLSLSFFFQRRLISSFSQYKVDLIFSFHKVMTYNTELNDLRKNICLRKSEDSVERILVCNAIEYFA